MSIIGDSLTYPFRGNGKYLLIIGAVLSILSDLASFAPLGLIRIIAVLILFGYFCAIYFEIIQTTSTGSDEAPEFPGVSDPLEDLVKPALWVIAVTLFAAAPTFAYFIFTDATLEEPGSPLIHYSLMFYFAFYFPITMLAVVNCGTLAAALPHVVVISIFRAGPIYLTAVALLVAVYIVCDMLTEQIASMSILVWPLISVVSMYAMMVNGRTLGLLYREREEELGWI